MSWKLRLYPEQGIPNIYRRGFHIGVRSKFILKARICAQQFSKLATPDRNNIITSVFDFLQPRLCFLIRVLQCLICVTNGLVSIGHTKTPMPKTPKLLKHFIRIFTVTIDFHIWHPIQMNFPPITGVSNIFVSDPCTPAIEEPQQTGYTPYGNSLSG